MRSPRAGALLLAIGLLGTACSGGRSDRDDAKAPPPETAPSSDPGDGSAQKRSPKDDSGEVRLAADPAPAFEVQTFDGTTFAVREEVGTPVVLNFWESW